MRVHSHAGGKSSWLLVVHPCSWQFPHSPALPPNHPTSPTCRISKFDASGTLLADFPLPFDAMEAAPAGAGGRAAKTPARGGRRAAAAADSSDEEDSDGAPQMPSDDDDDDDDAVRGLVA